MFYLGASLGLWQLPVSYALKQHKIPATYFNKAAVATVKKLVDNGYDAYLVGGCLRDGLCGIKPKDHDVVTNASPQQVKKLFRRSRIIGKRFRIVHVPTEQDFIEVCTFRARESWWGEFYAKWFKKVSYLNNVYGTIETDAWRRDISANALYYDIKNQQIIDFTNGYQDIINKKLQMIGHPVIRFRQDPVRILRVVRFAAKTQFNIDQVLERAIVQMAPSLGRASQDRLLLEVIKLFYHGHGRETLLLIDKYNLLEILFPGYSKMQHNKKHYMDFLKTALASSDRRYRESQNLSTGFLLAVLLWPILVQNLSKDLEKMKPGELHKAIKKTFKEQGVVVAITKKLQEIIEDIWSLQYHMQARTKMKIDDIRHHARARAAYDFLSIRAQVDESLANTTLKWHNIIS